MSDAPESKTNTLLSNDAWNHSADAPGLDQAYQQQSISGKSINTFFLGKIALDIKNHIQKPHLHWQVVVPGHPLRMKAVQIAQNTYAIQFPCL